MSNHSEQSAGDGAKISKAVKDNDISALQQEWQHLHQKGNEALLRETRTELNNMAKQHMLPNITIDEKGGQFLASSKNGNKTEFHVTPAEGASASALTRDKEGKVIRVEYPNHASWQMQYDRFGLTKLTSPDGRAQKVDFGGGMGNWTLARADEKTGYLMWFAENHNDRFEIDLHNDGTVSGYNEENGKHVGFKAHDLGPKDHAHSQVDEIDYGNGVKRTFHFDPQGNPDRIQEPSGTVWTREGNVDAQGEGHWTSSENKTFNGSIKANMYDQIQIAGDQNKIILVGDTNPADLISDKPSTQAQFVTADVKQTRTPPEWQQALLDCLHKQDINGINKTMASLVASQPGYTIKPALDAIKEGLKNEGYGVDDILAVARDGSPDILTLTIWNLKSEELLKLWAGQVDGFNGVVGANIESARKGGDATKVLNEIFGK